LDYLLRCWPAEEAEAYKDALIICRSAVEGKSDPELARDAFIVAGYEASIFMKFDHVNEDFIAHADGWLLAPSIYGMAIALSRTSA
jgi:hypothetical protein